MKPAPIKETVAFEDFEKLDIRAGTITSVEEVDNSNKLVKLVVDFGDHSRSILAGIKQERSDPREIEGKQALFVVNLSERKWPVKFPRDALRYRIRGRTYAVSVGT